MKKIFTFFVIVIFCQTAILPVFSQKTRNLTIKRVSSPKTLPQSSVKLSSAEAFSDGNGVYLRWQAESETGNLGFFIYRVGAKGTELVSPAMVGGGSLTSSESVVYGGKYSYFDAKGDATSSYYIESLGSNGGRQTFGQIFTKQLESLQSVAGSTSEDLIKRKEETKPTVDNNIVNLPQEIKDEVAANALSPDITNQRRVAAQAGVKIGVKQEGIYRVSRTELQNAGFNVSAPGNLWQLYVDGNEQSINVGTGDSYIEFYGKGIDTTESATKVYYLIVGAQNGKRIGTTVIRPVGGNVIAKSYSQTFAQKYRQVYISADILNGDAENFFSSSAIVGSNTPTPTATTLTLNLTGVDFTIPKSTIELNIQGITATPHQIVATVNGEPMDPISGSGKNLMSGAFQIPTSYLREGANTFQLQAYGGSGDISLTESIRVGYARKYEVNQNRLSFYTANYRTSTLSGFTSPNIRVFDLTYPDSPSVITNLRIDNNSGNYSAVLPAHRGRSMFAAEDSAVLTADSIVLNNPSTLATAAHNGELIIVTYKDWVTQANDWANYRRGQGMSVEVVDIDDIFDEFSYGSVSTAGMSSFFNYAKNNWQTAPNYILLMGDMSYDFRNYENRSFQNFVPTKLVDTVYEETGSDEALCDFNNDGLSEIAIGRIPARNAATVTQLLNKTMTFEANLGTAFGRGALFVSDLPNGYDFEGLSQRLANELPPSIPKTYINRGQPDARNLMLASMNQGRYLVNYSGHGSAGGWDGGFFGNADATALTNAPNYSLFFMLTCLNGYFLRTDFDSLGETVLKAPNGGAVAAWASTGKTTPDVQEVMAMRFYNQLNVSNMTRIGDYIADSKASISGGRDVRLSWALLGDPTLKIK
jgi:Peptidase family C25